MVQSYDGGLLSRKKNNNKGVNLKYTYAKIKKLDMQQFLLPSSTFMKL